METGTVAPLTKHLCAAMVAGLTSCTPLLVEHRRIARELGAGAQMLTDLWTNAKSEHYDAAQRSALAAAVALTREPRALPDTVWSALEAQFSSDQCVEVIAAIALANERARIENALTG